MSDDNRHNLQSGDLLVESDMLWPKFLFILSVDARQAAAAICFYPNELTIEAICTHDRLSKSIWIKYE